MTKQPNNPEVFLQKLKVSTKALTPTNQTGEACHLQDAKGSPQLSPQPRAKSWLWTLNAFNKRDKKQSHMFTEAPTEIQGRKKGNGRKLTEVRENAAIGSDDISAKYFAVNFKNQTKQFI